MEISNCGTLRFFGALGRAQIENGLKDFNVALHCRWLWALGCGQAAIRIAQQYHPAAIDSVMQLYGITTIPERKF